LPEVMAIENISFPNPWHETTFRGEMQNEDFSFPLAAVRRGTQKVIGYIIYWKIKDEIQINNIAVHPDYRRLGIGQKMLKEVLGRVREEEAMFASLEVRVSNVAAQTLYARLGFTLLGVRKGYYSNPDEDALVLGLNLTTWRSI